VLLGFITFFVVGCLAPGLVFSAARIELDLNQEHYVLSRDVEFLEDPEASLTLDDLLQSDPKRNWFLFQGGIPNFGFSSKAYWLRFGLKNSSDRDQVWFLELAYPLHDHVDLYTVLQDGSYQRTSTGDRLLFAQRDIQFRNFVFRLDLPAGAHQDFYMRTHSESSLQFPVNLWSPERFAEMVSGEQLALGIYYGSMLVIALYNLFIYISLRNSLYLYYIFYILSFGTYQFALNGLAFQYFLPNQPELAGRFLPWVGSLTAVFGLVFSRRFLQTTLHCPRFDWILKALQLTALVFLGVSMFASYTVSIIFGALVAALTAPALEIAGIIALRRGYRPARYFVLAFSAVLTGITIFHISRMGFFPSSPFLDYANQIGSLLEVILLSLALADKIKTEQVQYQKKIEVLNAELEDHIANVEAEVEEKTRDIRSIMEHIPLGIFMIKPDFKIHKDYSRHLQDLFQRSDLETCQASELIFSDSLISSDQIGQAESCLQASMGEDPVNFEFNGHTLPQELRRPGTDGTEQILDLTWNPISGKAGKVEKILVTLRDVTDIRKLQARSQGQQEELEFISEILNVPIQRFLRFIRSCQDLLQENSKLLRAQRPEKKNFDILKLLFINMHTIKGSARSLYLKKMTQVFHDIEQYYAQLQKNQSAAWDLKKMEAELGDAQAVVDLYERIAREKLGRSTNETQHVEFHMAQIEMVYRELAQSVQGKELPDDVRAGVGQALSLFHSKIFKSAQDVLDDLCGCLPVLARDLRKEIPRVDFQVDGFLLSDRAEELLRHTFVHLLRNTMDHGIEETLERIEAGKSAQGILRVHMERRGDFLILSYADDGRGLDIKRLRDIGLARGLLHPTEAEDVQAIASLIFHSGLSTANHLTDISGRGVGMDAVRRFVMQARGEIDVLVLPDPGSLNGFQAFQLVMKLPFDLFEQAIEPHVLSLTA
jgi:HPt (histidine-containing phosphotransfer) domain-containing protein/PAS domain-containing protein